MGDLLFAIGYDAFKPQVRIRIWVGSAYSVYDETRDDSYFVVDKNWAILKFISPKTILIGGDSVLGMSGAPVFNGCGISGISVGIDLRTHAKVVHISHLIELLSTQDASNYSVTLSEANTICDIPVKSYC